MGIAFERIVIVMLENSTVANVLANAYMNTLRTKGVFLSSSIGVTHPSQPNYILSIGGDTFGLCNDSPGYVKWGDYGSKSQISNIVDLLEAQELTWRCYAEDLPENYKADAVSGYPQTIPQDEDHFARRHVPFLSYPNIVTDPVRLSKIVNATQFEQDLANGELPDYTWYTPNLINDGHSLTPEQKKTCSDNSKPHVRIENVAEFLSKFLGNDPVSKFPPKTLIVITFDEVYPYDEIYSIYTLLIGDMLEAGTTVTTPYNHYSMLRSIEVNFDLGDLGRNDVTAMPWWFLAE
ncbi:MAG: hypothetical protein F6J96_35695 [Symploca sp. SIO1C2]|nr:hypothetical protein [Symploca sp. SIO1C2]